MAGAMYRDSNSAEDFRVRSAMNLALNEAVKAARFRDDLAKMQSLETAAVNLTKAFFRTKEGADLKPLDSEDGIPAKLLAEHALRAETAAARLQGVAFYQTLLGAKLAENPTRGAWSFDAGDRFESLTIRRQQIQGHCILSELTVVAIGANAGRREMTLRCAHAVNRNGQPFLLGIN
jgi:hypothetical protein